MNTPVLKDLIAKQGLNNFSTQIQALLKESIRLITRSQVSPDQPCGNSQLGGTPDLPEGYQWPVYQGKPMSFVAQVRLEDIAGMPPTGQLPASGLLSFFYDASQETYGDAPDNRGGWQVGFFGPSIKLTRAVVPLDLPKEAQFLPQALTFYSEWTLPSSPAEVVPHLRWSDQNQSKYEELLKDFYSTQNRKPPFHRMFGWPDQIQDDMQIQSAMMSSGVTDMNDPRMKVVEQKKAEWQLLLQIDSDDALGMRWASYGRLYYWIETQALKAQQFDHTWLVLQSD